VERRWLDASLLPTIVVRDDIVVYANPAAGALAGEAPEAIVGRPSSDFIAPEERERVLERRARRQRGEPVPTTYRTSLEFAGGRRVTVELHVAVTGQELVIQLVDVSVRVAQRARLNELAVLGARLQLERSEASILGAMRVGLGRLGLGAFLLRPEGDRLRVTLAAQVPGQEPAFPDVPGVPVGEVAGDWTDHGRRVWIEGAAFCDELAPEVTRFGGAEAAAHAPEIGAVLAHLRGIGLRIDSAGLPTAMLFLLANWLREEDVPAFRLFATQLSAAIDAARTIQDISIRNEELAARNRIAEIAASAPGLPEFFELGGQEIIRSVGCHGLAVWLLDDDRDELVLTHEFGGNREAGAAFRRVPVATSLTGQVMRSGKPRLLQREDYPPEARPILESTGLLTYAAVPLRFRGRSVGIATAGFRDRRDEQGARLHLLRAMAGPMAAAVETQRLLEDLRRRISELGLLKEVAVASANLELPGLLESVLRRIMDTFAIDACGAYLLEDGDMRLLASLGISEASAREMARVPIAHTDPGLATQRLEPFVIPRMADLDERSRYLYREERFETAAFVPVSVKGRPLGALVVGRRTPLAFQQGELGQISAVASQIGVAVENGRLFAEARRRLEDLSLVHEVGSAVAASLDLPAVLKVGTEAVRRLLDATQCVLLLLDREQGVLRMGGHSGELPREVENMALPLGATSLSARALRERRTIWVRDAVADPGVAHQYAAPFGTLSLIAAPLLVRDEPVGVVVAGDARRHRDFSPSEIDRMAAVANQLAVAIDNARLYSEARLRAEDLAVLLEVGRAVTASLDLGQVLETGAEAVRRLLAARHCVILLVDEEARALKLGGCTRDFPDHLRKLTLSLDVPSITSTAFSERRTMVVPDVSRDEKVVRALSQAVGTTAFLVTPLFQRDRPVGTVLVLETERPRHFTQAEVDRVTAVANQLSVAVENARLYEDLRRSYAELRQAQAQLLAQERLAALGELSAVVAHEVRNPLGVIFNSVGSLRRALRPEGDVRMLLDILQEEADRLNRIVGDLLDFARPAPPAPEAQSLEEALDGAVAAAVAGSNGAVRVERAIEPGLPPVSMDGHQIRQAFLNVAANAVQAMLRGGTLTVRARREGPWVRVDLEDEGPGIPPEVRRRVFQPFFTTKPSGTGLGLAVVKRIVEAHRGEVAFENLPGKGTRFTIRLPLEATAAGPPAVGG
jgi:PAS domain S-box-containing protein